MRGSRSKCHLWLNRKSSILRVIRAENMLLNTHWLHTLMLENTWSLMLMLNAKARERTSAGSDSELLISKSSIRTLHLSSILMLWWRRFAHIQLALRFYCFFDDLFVISFISWLVFNINIAHFWHLLWLLEGRRRLCFHRDVGRSVDRRFQVVLDLLKTIFVNFRTSSNIEISLRRSLI